MSRRCEHAAVPNCPTCRLLDMIDNLEDQLALSERRVKYWQDLAVANRSVAEAAQVRAEIALSKICL